MTIVTVVEMPEFQRRARAIMSDGERMELIDFVARNPMSGVSIGGVFANFVLRAQAAVKVAVIG